jgi:hypothetical protein
MDHYEWPHNALTIALLGGLYLEALHRGLYLAIIMDRYEGPNTTLSIALHGGLYLSVIMDRYERPHPALTIALRGGL